MPVGDPQALASYDVSRESWVAEPGMYTVSIGASCMDIKQRASFNLVKEIMVEKDHKALPIK